MTPESQLVQAAEQAMLSEQAVLSEQMVLSPASRDALSELASFVVGAIATAGFVFLAMTGVLAILLAASLLAPALVFLAARGLARLDRARGYGARVADP